MIVMLLGEIRCPGAEPGAAALWTSLPPDRFDARSALSSRRLGLLADGSGAESYGSRPRNPPSPKHETTIQSA